MCVGTELGGVFRVNLVREDVHRNRAETKKRRGTVPVRSHDTSRSLPRGGRDISTDQHVQHFHILQSLQLTFSQWLELC